MNFLTFLVLARIMPTDGFGVYVLAYSVLMFIQTMQHALVTRAHNVLGVRMDAEEQAGFTRSVFGLIAGGAAVITILLAGMAWVMLIGAGSELWGNALQGLALACIPWMIQDAMRRSLYTAERVSAAAVNDAVSYVLQATGVLFLAWTAGTASPFDVFLILGLSSLAAALVGVFQLKSVWAGGITSNLTQDARKIWAYGRWLSLGEFIGWIGQNGHAWLIGGLMGAPFVAGYRAATYVTNLLNPLDLAVSNYLPVRASHVLSEKDRPSMISWLRSKSVLLSLPYLVAAVGITLFAQPLLELFYGDKYSSPLLAMVLILAVWGRLLGFLVSFTRVGLMATEETRTIMNSQVIALFVFAIVSTLFVSWMGVIGAPVARLILHVIVGAYLVQALTRPSAGTTQSIKPRPEVG